MAKKYHRFFVYFCTHFLCKCVCLPALLSIWNNKWEGITRTIIDTLPYCRNAANNYLRWICCGSAQQADWMGLLLWFFFASSSMSFIGSMQLKSCNYTLFEAQLIWKTTETAANKWK